MSAFKHTFNINTRNYKEKEELERISPHGINILLNGTWTSILNFEITFWNSLTFLCSTFLGGWVAGVSASTGSGSFNPFTDEWGRSHVFHRLVSISITISSHTTRSSNFVSHSSRGQWNYLQFILSQKFRVI